ncbi:FAD-dependent monooxygenase [Candidatus Synchoanobacter obligatus]|uniref:FAD-dependent monooxygenase n=1 Tax=Candidatus Synchoanobacter obligatus TaxID=2919597 RepID=A0ABT1L569_9GAMM|nr:FAD-dependent monooxygenase [Candidatus Synchoanobacter obligatus]MCP8352101.1 FAD-dependent monooxygenase [Candidatus Synchoanobacter obligatus]
MTHPNTIIGAGLVGQLMAINLAQHGAKPLLIGPPPKFLKSMVLAIHPSHMHFFQQLGLDIPSKAIKKMVLQTHHNLQIDQKYSKHAHLCHIVHYGTLVHHIENKRRLHQIAWLKEQPKALNQGRIKIGDAWIEPENIIACDGSHSWTRSHTPILVQREQYDQYAHIAMISHTAAHEIAYQAFLPQGTLALLPTNNPYLTAVIWSCDTQQHVKIKTDSFKNQLSAYTHKLGKIIKIEHHHNMPIVASLAETYAHQNIFLLGNALHTIHPLAGIGFNLAISDCQTLTDTILNRLPPETYTKKRKAQHLKAHYLTRCIAKTRGLHQDKGLNKILKGLLPLQTCQQIILEQIDAICL